MPVFVLCWLFAAVLIGFSGVLRNTALPMPALAIVLTVALLAVLAVSREYRRRALDTGIRALVAVHLVRFFGIYFLWLAAQGLIAGDHATLAGWGPIIIAIGALIVLYVFRSGDGRAPQAVLVWNIVGLLDAAVVLAVMAQMTSGDALVQGGFTSLPLSLLPTFVLPLLIVTHLLIFVWLRKQLSNAHVR